MTSVKTDSATHEDRKNLEYKWRESRIGAREHNEVP